MKLMKSALICCALLLAGTLSACEVSDAPQQDGTLNSREPAVTEIVENNSGGDQAAGQNGDATKPASDNGAGNAASAGDGQAAQQNNDAPAQNASGNGQSAQETPKQDTPAAADNGDSYKVGSEPALSIGVVHAKPGQKSVPVTVKIHNNPGFCAGGIRVIYDPAITPQYDPDSFQGVSDKGTAVSGSMLTYCSVAPENLIVAYGILGQENSSENGNLFTCYFNIPENAASGKVYKLQTELAELKNENGDNVNLKMIGGEIRID